MDMAFFKVQIDRLKQVYGDASYPQERIKLLWKEFRSSDNSRFESVISEVLGSCRFAPMLKEFREAWSKEKERYRVSARKIEARDAKEFWNGKGLKIGNSEKDTFHIEDKFEIMRMIKRRLAGRVSGPDWDSFMDTLCVAAKVSRKEVDATTGNVRTFPVHTPQGAPVG
jgi:hypothetical protein